MRIFIKYISFGGSSQYIVKKTCSQKANDDNANGKAKNLIFLFRRKKVLAAMAKEYLLSKLNAIIKQIEYDGC